MSVLGYCPLCERLVPILPKEHKFGSRERWWQPVEHENNEGVRCDGTTKRI